ncbi:hypothetical protein [Bradyrhizobium sp. B117]|uniref:hypothetical protein n=1 Tax=Bradyrhizobium sp. B117 TaxID=3140246 RepID=UPI0031832620
MREEEIRVGTAKHNDLNIRIDFHGREQILQLANRIWIDQVYERIVHSPLIDGRSIVIWGMDNSICLRDDFVRACKQVCRYFDSGRGGRIEVDDDFEGCRLNEDSHAPRTRWRGRTAALVLGRFELAWKGPRPYISIVLYNTWART